MLDTSPSWVAQFCRLSYEFTGTHLYSLFKLEYKALRLLPVVDPILFEPRHREFYVGGVSHGTLFQIESEGATKLNDCRKTFDFPAETLETKNVFRMRFSESSLKLQIVENFVQFFRPKSETKKDT